MTGPLLFAIRLIDESNMHIKQLWSGVTLIVLGNNRLPCANNKLL